MLFITPCLFALFLLLNVVLGADVSQDTSMDMFSETDVKPSGFKESFMRNKKKSKSPKEQAGYDFNPFGFEWGEGGDHALGDAGGVHDQRTFKNDGRTAHDLDCEYSSTDDHNPFPLKPFTIFDMYEADNERLAMICKKNPQFAEQCREFLKDHEASSSKRTKQTKIYKRKRKHASCVEKKQKRTVG